MIADLGTRPTASLPKIDQNSDWINGHTWMTEHTDSLPLKSIEGIRLGKDELLDVKRKSVTVGQWVDEIYHADSLIRDIDNSHVDCPWDICALGHSNQVDVRQSKDVRSNVPELVRTCYSFSDYPLDPNKYRYNHVIRVMACVFKYINNLQLSCKVNRSLNIKTDLKHVILTDEELLKAKNDYFWKASLEVKHFMRPSEYENSSVEKDGIIYHTGRILPIERIGGADRMSEAMRDLSTTSFCVPVVYKHSPLACSIVNVVHWHSKIARHTGIETVWRYVLKTAFIFSGRKLVKKFKVNCSRCRYLRKKFIDVEMGPLIT